MRSLPVLSLMRSIPPSFFRPSKAQGEAFARRLLTMIRLSICCGDFRQFRFHASADVDQKDEIEWLLLTGEDSERLLVALVKNSKILLVHAGNRPAAPVQNLRVHVKEGNAGAERS
jgi:hypothetical protein